MVEVESKIDFHQQYEECGYVVAEDSGAPVPRGPLVKRNYRSSMQEECDGACSPVTSCRQNLQCSERKGKTSGTG